MTTVEFKSCGAHNNGIIFKFEKIIRGICNSSNPIYNKVLKTVLSSMIE